MQAVNTADVLLPRCFGAFHEFLGSKVICSTFISALTRGFLIMYTLRNPFIITQPMLEPQMSEISIVHFANVDEDANLGINYH